jgi:hypothetical protein
MTPFIAGACVVAVVGGLFLALSLFDEKGDDLEEQADKLARRRAAGISSKHGVLASEPPRDGRTTHEADGDSSTGDAL